MAFIDSEVIDIITDWTNQYRYKKYADSFTLSPSPLPTQSDLYNGMPFDPSLFLWADLNTTTALTPPTPQTSPFLDETDLIFSENTSLLKSDTTEPTVHPDVFTFSINDYYAINPNSNSTNNVYGDVSKTLSTYAGTQLTLPDTIKPASTQKDTHSTSVSEQSILDAATHSMYSQPSVNGDVTPSTSSDHVYQAQQLLSQANEQQETDLRKKKLQKEADDKKIHDANFLIKTSNWIDANIVKHLAENTSSPLIGKAIELVGGVFTGLIRVIGEAFEDTPKTSKTVHPQNNQIQQALANIETSANTSTAHLESQGLKTKLGSHVPEGNVVYPYSSELTKN